MRVCKIAIQNSVPKSFGLSYLLVFYIATVSCNLFFIEKLNSKIVLIFYYIYDMLVSGHIIWFDYRFKLMVITNQNICLTII